MRRPDRRVSRILWTSYGVLAVLGLAILAEALFVPRVPQPYKPPPLGTAEPTGLIPLGGPSVLAEKRMTRRVAVAPVPSGPAKPTAVPLDSLIRLTGILDFDGKQPTLAVIETPSTNETKAYRSGDKVGETGVVVREIKDGIIVEYEKRRFKVTYAGIREIPANSVGAKE